MRGDFRLEVVEGALLIQQVRWDAVRECIQKIGRFLEDKGEELIKSGRFSKQRTHRVRGFCRLVKEEAGSIDQMFRGRTRNDLCGMEIDQQFCHTEAPDARRIC